jgi:hypothetical protein
LHGTSGKDLHQRKVLWISRDRRQDQERQVKRLWRWLTRKRYVVITVRHAKPTVIQPGGSPGIPSWSILHGPEPPRVLFGPFPDEFGVHSPDTHDYGEKSVIEKRETVIQPKELL